MCVVSMKCGGLVGIKILGKNTFRWGYVRTCSVFVVLSLCFGNWGVVSEMFGCL